MASPVPATPENIDRAAKLIRSGGLVAFPTETVYGLGANALDAAAVSSIFAAKGRPATNPVIVHVSSPASADELAVVGARARNVMAALWPGPVTLVLPKRDCIPSIVTAGGATVALRMPRHPAALALLEAAGVPIAAPSANRSESLSPTRAEHVAASLGDAVAMILDGGSTDVGLESTVLDLTVTPARILRPGMADIAAIEAALGERLARSDGNQTGSAAKSPGQMLRHYAPRTPLVLVSDLESTTAITNGSLAVLRLDDGVTTTSPPVRMTITLPLDPKAYAARLYDSLHTLDAAGAKHIVIQAPPTGPDWDAIWDRIFRAIQPKDR